MEEDFNTNEVLLSIGRLGKWQLISYLCMAAVLCTSACFAMLQVVFIGKCFHVALYFWGKMFAAKSVERER